MRSAISAQSKTAASTRRFSSNTGVLNREGVDADDDDDDDVDDDDEKDDLNVKESPAVTLLETPDTKRKLQPELETLKKNPIPVYDAATVARNAELDKAAKKWMADKEQESMGRGKDEAAYEER